MSIHRSIDMIKVSDRLREPIEIGVQGENIAREISFDYTEWIETYGEGSVMVTVERDGAVYEAADYAADNGTCIWSPDATDTAVDGFGMVELSYIAGDVVAKTVIFETVTLPGIGEGVAPEPYENILTRIHEEVTEAEAVVDDVMDAATRAEEAAEYAEEAAGSAIKVKNMTVSAETLPAGSQATVNKTETETAFNLEFGIPQGERGERGDKGIQGETGNGIANAVLNADYTLTIAFTDGTSYTTPPIRGEQGVRGIQGETGEPGATGNGIASAVLNSDYTLTLTFTDGTSYTTPSIRGATGAKGADGADGDDYVLTAQDKSDIADLVIAELPTWTGGAY